MRKWRSVALACGLVVVLGYACSRSSCCRSRNGPGTSPQAQLSADLIEDAGIDAGGMSGGCTETDCGVNGVWLGNGVKFRTLHLSPYRANDAGLSIIGFLGPDGEPLAIDIQGDVLRGTNQQTGEVLDHDKLNGAQLLLGHPMKESNKAGNRSAHALKLKAEYALTISVDKAYFWAQCSDCDDAAKEFPVYRFSAKDNNGNDITMCAPGRGPIHSLAAPPKPINIDGVAVMFRGDYYDQKMHEVSTTPAAGDDDLFNIACLGTAISKLHLLRHTSASQLSPDDPRNPGIAERQTMLRLLTADYCGNGSSFTEDGMPIHFRFNSPLYTLTEASQYALSNGDSLEALWTSKGALCIGAPRLLRSGDKQWNNPETLINKIRNACAKSYGNNTPVPTPILPDCSTIGTASLETPFASDNYAISGNPEVSYQPVDLARGSSGPP